MVRSRSILAALLSAGALAGALGCTSAPEVREGIARRRDPERAAAVTSVVSVLSEREDDSGPSALATVLDAAGIPVTLDETREAVFDEKRGGTPPSAMVRFARARGAFGLVRAHWYLDDMKAWIRAGVAPVVRLELAPILPGKYHYVVLRGFDDDHRVLLISDQRGEEVTLADDAFFGRWAATDGWALVVCSAVRPLPLEKLGLEAPELGALGRLAEKQGALELARDDYKAALVRDPGYEPASHNLGSVERALGKP